MKAVGDPELLLPAAWSFRKRNSFNYLLFARIAASVAFCPTRSLFLLRRFGCMSITYTSMYMYVCMYVCIYIYTHTHTHTTQRIVISFSFS